MVSRRRSRVDDFAFCSFVIYYDFYIDLRVIPSFLYLFIVFLTEYVNIYLSCRIALKHQDCDN